MNVYRYPSDQELPLLLKRPTKDAADLNATVAGVLEDVKQRGDDAVREYEAKFDRVELQELAVAPEEIEEAMSQVGEELINSIRLAHENIRRFHSAQKFQAEKVEVRPGVTCWQKAVPIQKVGLYIPGGTAPLFSTVLMLATPAKIAGCQEIVLCTPPGKDGKVNPAILVAARVAGVSRIYKIGGVQAIGAMAYGTQSVPKVYKIFGPGNQYVTCAKQQVSLHDVAIDMPAGPSEVEVLADATSNPAFVAADLLSQAEHGIDSQVLLVTNSEEMIDKVQEEVKRQLAVLSRNEIATQALENSKIILVHTEEEMLRISNLYAPEHLIIETRDYMRLAEGVVNAGSVFLGSLTPESAGDYASGTNHTLPTHGYAVAYNGVNLDSYIRKVTFQHITEEGIRQIGPAVECMAGAESLQAHRHAMELRSEYVRSVTSDEKVCKTVQNDLSSCVRPNIQSLKPYSCARDEFKGMDAHVFLDANENPYNNPYDRYPDPLQEEVKDLLARRKGVHPSQIFLGNGSDEAIDLVYRIFCRPGKDNVVAIAPTYGMYEVSADINDVEYRSVLLDEYFQIDAEKLLAATDDHTKVIWLCSPNNPTGNDLNRDEVLKVIRGFRGIVVMDEAYSDFSSLTPLRFELEKYPNLIVLNTFSKAWALAAIRMGIAYASPEIIALFNKVKYPYNVNMLSQQKALEILKDSVRVERWVRQILHERESLLPAFAELPICKAVYPSAANFFLARVTDANDIYRYLISKGIVVRNRHRVALCGNCLRVTVGTPDENNELLSALRQYKS